MKIITPADIPNANESTPLLLIFAITAHEAPTTVDNPAIVVSIRARVNELVFICSIIITIFHCKYNYNLSDFVYNGYKNLCWISIAIHYEFRMYIVNHFKFSYICNMNIGKTKILIVDDEETLREGLKEYLELEGYEADTAPGGEAALENHIEGYDLILLDVMMDGMSGFELATKLKHNPETANIPIIFLTAKDTDEDMVAGLNLGADDYVSKPFSIKNMIARIEAVLRRTKKIEKDVNVVCDRQTLTCTVDGKNIKMPRKEFEILALLLEHPGKIFSREELLNAIWPENVVVVDRSVDVHITRIRNKIAPYSKKLISRSGYGYGWQN